MLFTSAPEEVVFVGSKGAGNGKSLAACNNSGMSGGGRPGAEQRIYQGVRAASTWRSNDQFIAFDILGNAEFSRSLTIQIFVREFDVKDRRRSELKVHQGFPFELWISFCVLSSRRGLIYIARGSQHSAWTVQSRHQGDSQRTKGF